MFVTLTASIYYPFLRKQFVLATMNCKHEDSNYVADFWKKFNEAFWKVNKTPKKFHLCGWVTDMASANFNGLAIFYGEDIRSRVRSKVEVKQDDKFVQCDLCNKQNHIKCDCMFLSCHVRVSE